MSIDAQPQWIAKMYPATAGQDHLGLGSVSSARILASLSPGINALTYHPRYFSFYAFLLDEFWRRDRSRTSEGFKAFYRPRECIFSIGAHLCDRQEHQGTGRIVGSSKTNSLASKKLKDYDATTNYIKEDLGGYGLYYGSVMADVGLVHPTGPGSPYKVDVLTDAGKEVADAFRQAVKSTRYYRDYFDDDSACVPYPVVVEFIHHACLCQLQCSDAPDRPLLLNTFLHGLNKDASDARRSTFRLFLDIAAQTQGQAVDADGFRQLLYFQSTDRGLIYEPRDAVRYTHRQWRLYQAREYYVFALNTLWYYLCEWGVARGGDARPIPLSSFWQHLDASLTFDVLAEHFHLPSPTLAETSPFVSLVDWLQEVVGAGEETGGFDGACTLGSPLNEHLLYAAVMKRARAHQLDTSLMIAGMIAMLAMIYLRFCSPALWLSDEWSIARMGEEQRLSMDGFVKTIRRRMQSGPVTIGGIARWLYDEYIIRQHQLTALSKMPQNNTFRFQREGDRLRFYLMDNGLGFNDSRFESLSTTIHDLGLSGNFSRSNHPLTDDGLHILDQGELP